MVDVSIFGLGDAASNKAYETAIDFAASDHAGNTALDRALGCMMGMPIGDSWGHVLEFVPCQYEEVLIPSLTEASFLEAKGKNAFRLLPGQFTDDTSMGLCLADTLLTRARVDPLDYRKRILMWWFHGYNNAFRFDLDRAKRPGNRLGRTSVGLGGTISWSLAEFVKDPTSEYT